MSACQCLHLWRDVWWDMKTEESCKNVKFIISGDFGFALFKTWEIWN